MQDSRGDSAERGRGAEPPPSPCAHAAGDAAQGTVGLLGCQRTLRGHAQLLPPSSPSPSPQGCSLSLHPQPVLLPGLPRPRCRTLHLALLNLTRFPQPQLCSPSGSLWMASPPSGVGRTTQRGVICKLAEAAHSSTVHVADKDVKQHRSQSRPLRNATPHCSSLGHQAIDRNSSSATIKLPVVINSFRLFFLHLEWHRNLSERQAALFLSRDT